MARRRGIITLALVAAMGFSHAPVSHAQFGGVVYDPANYVQNFYTAVRSYTQIIRQAQQLRNEANMLINEPAHGTSCKAVHASAANANYPGAGQQP